MKYTKKKNDASTIRKVWSNDKEVCYGVVGTIGDLLKANILEYCDYSSEAWCFIPATGIMHKVRFGQTREDVVKELPDF